MYIPWHIRRLFGTQLTFEGALCTCVLLLAGCSGDDSPTAPSAPAVAVPAARHSSAVAAVNGILYAVGGASEGASSVATVYAYDPVSNTWSAKASMPTARYAPGAATLNGILYTVGGFNYDLTPDGGQTTLEAYHP